MFSKRGSGRPSGSGENLYANSISDTVNPKERADFVSCVFLPIFDSFNLQDISIQEKKKSAAHVVDDWYNENFLHKYGKSDFSHCAGHFTQVIFELKQTIKLKRCNERKCWYH